MHIFFYNLEWMVYNIFLSIIAVILAFFMLRVKKFWLKVLLTISWLAFLPNTIYMITDISHLFEQWNQVTFIFKFLIFTQYFVLISIAVITFVVALYPL